MLKSNEMTLNQFTQVPFAGAKWLGKLGSFQEGTFLTAGTATARVLQVQLKIFITTSLCPKLSTFQFNLIQKKFPQGTAFPPFPAQVNSGFFRPQLHTFSAMLIFPIFNPYELMVEVLFSLTKACGSIPTDSLDRCTPGTLEFAWVIHLYPLTKAHRGKNCNCIYWNICCRWNVQQGQVTGTFCHCLKDSSSSPTPVMPYIKWIQTFH